MLGNEMKSRTYFSLGLHSYLISLRFFKSRLHLGAVAVALSLGTLGNNFQT